MFLQAGPMKNSFLIYQKNLHHTSSNKSSPKYVSPDSFPDNQLSSFPMEFKQIINPLIQLLTTVLNKSILKDDK